MFDLIPALIRCLSYYNDFVFMPPIQIPFKHPRKGVRNLVICKSLESRAPQYFPLTINVMQQQGTTKNNVEGTIQCTTICQLPSKYLSQNKNKMNMTSLSQVPCSWWWPESVSVYLASVGGIRWLCQASIVIVRYSKHLLIQPEQHQCCQPLSQSSVPLSYFTLESSINSACFSAILQELWEKILSRVKWGVCC